ncbi:MAG: LPS export ABC transporter ATP-binding protein [Deltaproteobacteria bacterium]|nr:LPS export ABC transporter ATP-binding protein [Deltaproteobacteria bacterium]
MLEAKSLYKRFGNRSVVRGVDLSVRSGETVGLLGPNGAGKTTCFYMTAGFLKPDQGSVHLDGRDITSVPMHKRAMMGLIYLPQEPSVFRRMTVRQNIITALELRHVSKTEQNGLARTLLNEFGLSSLASQRADTLSGGERRKVEIARALATKPIFILLDEPFSGLDPLAVEDLKEVIAGLKQKGMGILLTDHNVWEALPLCDRASILNEGEVLVSGEPEELAQSREARSAYLGQNFRLR